MERLGGGGGGAACTMVFADVGAKDGNGTPLKESSKAKMGLLSRSEEDAEYVGLSSEVPPPSSGSLASPSYWRTSSVSALAPSRRVVLKRSKLNMGEDECTGSTPKLVIPRRRLLATGADMRGGGRMKGREGGRWLPLVGRLQWLPMARQQSTSNGGDGQGQRNGNATTTALTVMVGATERW